MGGRGKMEIAFLLMILSSSAFGQRQDIQYFQPSYQDRQYDRQTYNTQTDRQPFNNQFETQTERQVSSGQGRSIGLAIDDQSIPEAMDLFPILYSSPSRIYLLVFNTTGIIRSRRIDSGWSGVESWITKEGLVRPYGGRSYDSREGSSMYDGSKFDGRGGASMYALLSLAQAVPPATPLILITSRQPSDTDLRYQALSALRDKQIQVHVYWVGKSNGQGKYYLEETALNTGGKFQQVATTDNNIHALKQVTLLVRDKLQGDTRSQIEVDSSLVDLIITIRGSVNAALLTPPSGYKQIDLVDNRNDEVHNKTITLSGRDTGTWYLDIKSTSLYSLTVQGSSHLALWATSSNTSAVDKKQVVELWLEGNGVRRVDEVELVDSEGKQLAALGHRDMLSPDDNTVSSTVELDTLTTATRQPAFLRLTATNNNGERLTRLTRLPDEMRLPTSIEVGLGSTLTASPGQRAVIYFIVANNRRQPLFYDFLVSDNFNWIRSVQPYSSRTLIGGMSSEQVKVELQIPYDQAQNPEPNVIKLRAQLQTGESVTQRAYLRVGQTSYDSTSPSITYSYNGDCSNTLGPETCYIGTWGANVTIQDYTSGLLQITSKPVALVLDREFIAGTKDPVVARFTATCCQTKVEVTATDTIGNQYSRVIDIERKWLSAGEISAIVLGCLLLLLLIIIIILSIVWCCRRNKRTLVVYPDH